MVLLSSKQIQLGTPAPDFKLPGIDNRVYNLQSFKNHKYILVVFMCVHCPYVQAIESELIYIKDKFMATGLEIIGINANDAEKYPEDSLESMQKRARALNYNFTYLHDFDQETAKAYEAVCTPDIYLYNQERELVYHGRIKEVPEVLERLEMNETFDKPMVPSQGCSIKWK